MPLNGHLQSTELSLIVCTLIVDTGLDVDRWIFVFGSAETCAGSASKLGLSQEALAHEAGIHRTYVSDVERGARNPTVTVVEKLAYALRVKAGELLDGPAGTGLTPA